jgi:hypothetical protein
MVRDVKDGLPDMQQKKQRTEDARENVDIIRREGPPGSLGPRTRMNGVSEAHEYVDNGAYQIKDSTRRNPG